MLLIEPQARATKHVMQDVFEFVRHGCLGNGAALVGSRRRLFDIISSYSLLPPRFASVLANSLAPFVVILLAPPSLKLPEQLVRVRSSQGNLYMYLKIGADVRTHEGDWGELPVPCHMVRKTEKRDLIHRLVRGRMGLFIMLRDIATNSAFKCAVGFVLVLCTAQSRDKSLEPGQAISECNRAASALAASALRSHSLRGLSGSKRIITGSDGWVFVIFLLGQGSSRVCTLQCCRTGLGRLRDRYC